MTSKSNTIRYKAEPQCNYNTSTTRASDREGKEEIFPIEAWLVTPKGEWWTRYGHGKCKGTRGESAGLAGTGPAGAQPLRGATGGSLLTKGGSKVGSFRGGKEGMDGRRAEEGRASVYWGECACPLRALCRIRAGLLGRLCVRMTDTRGRSP